MFEPVRAGPLSSGYVMVRADNPDGRAGQSTSPSTLPANVSLLIVGGGIMGLWAAVKADRLGIETLLLDAAETGHGASGGLLGALMPHVPDRWSDKKQFQFDALLTLEDEIARLEAETGLTAGYRRCGRIIPLPKPHLRPIAERHRTDAEAHWDQHGRRFHWHVVDDPPVNSSAGSWVNPEAGAAGFVHDTFAAKVSPRALLAVLRQRLRSSRHVRIVENCAVRSIDSAGMAHLDDGRRIGFGHVVVAAGHQAFPLLADALHLRPGRPLGQPVKGQAAALAMKVDPGMPIIFLNGLYVVPHDDGTVAIGSTSEEEFEDRFSTDDKLDQLIERARTVVPVLKEAEVIERWAGLRPKAVGRDPMVGPLPDHPRIIALAGGFKVSFGLAHRLADAALSAIGGGPMARPCGFSVDDHISVLAQKP